MADDNDYKNRAYFFDAGLRFGCVKCGGCCQGEPGVVRVSKAELGLIAQKLGLPTERLFETGFVDAFETAYRLNEEPANGRCVFFKEGAGCSIYEVRPQQCRTWPFWLGNLRSMERWRAAARNCPGIGRGRLFTKEEILALLNL